MHSDNRDYIFKELVANAEAILNGCITISELIDNLDDKEQISKRVKVLSTDSNERVMCISFYFRDYCIFGDREGDFLYDLGKAIDKCINTLYELTSAFVRYDIKELRDDVSSGLSGLKNVAQLLLDVVLAFREMDKIKTPYKSVNDIKHYRNESFNSYDSSIKKLFTSSKSPIEVLAWQAIYFDIKATYDAFADTADLCEFNLISQ